MVKYTVKSEKWFTFTKTNGKYFGDCYDALNSYEVRNLIKLNVINIYFSDIKRISPIFQNYNVSKHWYKS